MKKLATTIALGALSVLLLAGCAASPAAGQGLTTAKTGVSKVAVVAPKPTPAQAASLKAEFARIKPALNTSIAVSAAQRQCSGILEEWPDAKQLATTKITFSAKGSKPVTDTEATRILKVIKTNGFCKA